MMTPAGLLHWWNLVFLLPIALSVLLLLASAAGGLGEGGSGHADTNDADVDAHADVGDVDAHADADMHAGADGHSDAATGSNAGSGALHLVGVGAVPVSLLAQGFLLFFGVAGLAANLLLNTETDPERRVWIAFAVALVVGVLGAAGMGALGRRFLPKPAPAIGNKDLVGRTGRVVFAVTGDEGTVQVRDAVGTLHQVAARLAPGDSAPLASGQEILVTGYDREHGAFLVDESPFTLSADVVRRDGGDKVV
jgi:membrane protein implicated in regulation of membrane protease activity